MRIYEYEIIKIKGRRIESSVPPNLWRIYGYYIRVFMNTLNEIIYQDDELSGWIITITQENFNFDWKSEYLIKKNEEIYE